MPPKETKPVLQAGKVAEDNTNVKLCSQFSERLQAFQIFDVHQVKGITVCKVCPVLTRQHDIASACSAAPVGKRCTWVSKGQYVIYLVNGSLTACH